MTDVELNAILYYADYLSLRDTSTPVTDQCKYYFVYGTPINCAFLVGSIPNYDEDNQYFKKAVEDYKLVQSRFGDEGIMSFVDDICNLRAAGTVNGELMLKHIHQYSTKNERKYAMNKYKNWLNDQTYTHTVIGENGEERQEQCTKYVAHYEKGFGR